MTKIIRQLFPCGTISTGYAADCTTKPIAGTEVDFFAFNRDDIDSITHDTDNPLIITGITMKAGKYAYKFKGLKTSNDHETNLNIGKYNNNWIHKGSFVIFSNDPDDDKLVEDISDSNLCIAYIRKKKGTNGREAIKFLGEKVGLECTKAFNKASDADTQGSWAIEVTTVKDQFEDHVPGTIWDTDYSTSVAILDALVQVAS